MLHQRQFASLYLFFLCVLCFCRMSSTQMTCSHFRKNRPKKRLKPAGCRSRIISKNRPVPIFGRSTGASLVLFSRGFPRIARFFVSGVTWSVRVSSGKTLLVLARGFPPVALWCYGFGTVLDLIDGWFSRRESSGPARVGGRSCESGKRSFEEFPRVQRFKRCSRESARTRARSF